jgi:cellulose synthase/poly-beta-1,6-N-acetylglucosamine synthase-like glycosyltransferase
MDRTGMDASPKLTIIIPTFHSQNLGQVVEAVEQQSLKQAIEAIFVVGQQPDWELLRDQVRYIPVENMPTSARNRNMGVDLANTEWICFLDSDCIPDICWLEKLAQMIQQGERAVVGAVLIPEANSYWNHCDYLAGFTSQIPGLSSAMYLEYATMTNFLIRKDVFLNTGGFDEEFSTTGEDREFCWRLVNSGTKIRFAREAIIIHDHSRENFKQTWNHLFNFGHGTARFRMKHLQSTGLLWKFGYRVSRIPLLGEVVGIMRVCLTWFIKVKFHPSLMLYGKYLPGVILLNIAHTFGMIYTLRTYAPKN